LKKGREIARDRKLIRQQLQALDNKLLMALDLDQTLAHSIEMHRSMLHNIDDYLGGS
jgi:TFIIF-interacting CTD phosphatase-like protein